MPSPCLRHLVLLAWALCASGCSSVAIEGPTGLHGQRTYVGLVRISPPAADAQAGATPGVQQLDISTWGLRLDRGVSLGYLHDQLLSLPQACRLVIFVRNVPELAHAARLLRSIQQESPCFIQEPS